MSSPGRPPSPRPRPRRRGTAARPWLVAPAILAAAALAGCGGAAAAAASPAPWELLPASGFRPHYASVYELEPQRDLDVGGGHATKINGGGYRGEPISPLRRPGQARVLFLGGSRIFGVGQPDGATLPSISATLLSSGEADAGAWAVANLAVPGSTSHEIAGALGLRWIALEPDLLVVGDLDADARALTTPGFRDDYGHLWRVWVPRPEDAGRRLGECVAAQVPASVAARRAAAEASSTAPFERNLAAILDLAAGRGVPVVILLPDAMRAADPAELVAATRLRARAAEIAKARGATALDEAEVAPASMPDGRLRNEALARALVPAIRERVRR